ncbi:hypothetical protein HY025_03420 [Candidatus Daviesbacteria bacterium]|nr:hypothetical protein [Candidatus Daviesbacteria bacterium]
MRKIPTLLGLGLLIIAIALGIGLFEYSQQINQQSQKNFEPQDIEISNITSNQGTITWQTNIPTEGSIIFGPTKNFGFEKNDDRDKNILSSRLTHFVTLAALNPDTNYFFKIKSGDFYYPSQELKSFHTATITTDSSSLTQPVLGSIVDKDFQPVDDTLVFLNIPGAAKISTFTITDGNFVLPLTNLYTPDLKSTFSLKSTTLTTLALKKGSIHSEVKVNLPLGKTQLPPVVLGQDLDLSDLANNIFTSSNSLDLNNDGVINVVDLAIIIDNLGEFPTIKQADLNKDGTVDQADIDLIKKYLKDKSSK